MKKIIFTLLLIIGSFSLVSCGNTNSDYTLTLEGSPQTYQLTDSNAQGIEIKPKLISKEETNNFDYQWVTTSGAFLENDISKESIITSGESVIWSPSLTNNSDNNNDANTSLIEITLFVKDKDTIITKSSLTVQLENNKYTIIDN